MLEEVKCLQESVRGTVEEAQAPNTVRQIRISELNNGFVVEVGCQSFAIETKARLITLLANYIQEPRATEEKYRAGKLF
jgi:hypothetical protein